MKKMEDDLKLRHDTPVGSSRVLGSEGTENPGPLSANGQWTCRCVVHGQAAQHVYSVHLLSLPVLCHRCMCNAACDTLMESTLIPFPVIM